MFFEPPVKLNSKNIMGFNDQKYDDVNSVMSNEGE